MTEVPSSPSSQEPRLESWKEIAGYLNRDARTVRRWEQSEGLPVHRHRHLARSSVYAFPGELDAWRANRTPETRLPEVRRLSRWQRSLVLAPMMAMALAAVSSGRSVPPPDRTAELTSRRTDGPSRSFGLVSTDDGKLTVLKSMLWRAAGQMALSPDGRWLAVDLPESDATRKRDVFVYDVTGGRETAVVQRPGSDVLVGWSPDGSHIVFESDREGRR